MVQKFDKYMFPILYWLKDGSIRTNKETQERMVEYFQHTEEDLKEQTPRGGSRFKGNVNWALTFLYQAGLTKKPKNGKHQISEKGRQYLSEGMKVLMVLSRKIFSVLILFIFKLSDTQLVV